MNTEKLEAAFVKAFESNSEFMAIVREFPEDIYKQRSTPEFNERYPNSRYVKYAGYKELIHFHAPKLLHLPAAKPGATALDVGGGPGYLAFMLRVLGYQTLVTDIPETDDIKIMTRLRKALDIETIYAPIEPFKKMPALPHQPFSLVTATNLVFDEGWSLPQYTFWLEDIASRMKEDGAIYIYFNHPQYEKIWENPNFIGFFLNSGAKEVVPRRALVLYDMEKLKRNLARAAQD